MSKNAELFKLPAGPAEICFDKNEFMKKTFSVDEFLQDHRNAATLETMRDDLGVYLKVLRSAMIELINEDYADFVNLSSNLVGLDQSIHGIQSPLVGLRDEILSVKKTLEETMCDVNECLEQKRNLREHLRSIQSLTKVQQSTEKLTRLLNEQLHDDEALNPTIVERAALELTQLKFDLQFCQQHILQVEGNGELVRYEDLRRDILGKIDKHFLRMLSTRNAEQLERCLRIYCTLDECVAAEALFRKAVVGPYMHPIISENSLQNAPQGLTGIYRQILAFIDDKLKQLLALTQPKANGEIVKGYDFLVNGFWAEVEHRLETHMSSIFAPGNPDAFYQKYKCTNEFLERIESVIGTASEIQRFREHKQYKQFQTRWNLPVYFQIRFQEIGGALETSCSKPIDKTILDASSTAFKLKTFTVALSCIGKCWEDGVYLPQLFVRFWKLTLQILGRICVWADECTSLKQWPANDEISRIDLLVILYLHIVAFVDKLSSIQNVVVEKMPASLNAEIPLLEKSLSDSSAALRARLERIQDCWNREMLAQVTGWAKQVADIPRLYRKTNREAPTRACNYVEQILRPAKNFHSQYGERIDRVTYESILAGVFTQLNKQYYAAVVDVLTSVQKTEESLRRLKNLREKSGNANQPERAGGMSDDDKIRLQLHVDIITWTNEIEKLGIGRMRIEKLTDLITLVEESTRVRVTEKH